MPIKRFALYQVTIDDESVKTMLPPVDDAVAPWQLLHLLSKSGFILDVYKILLMVSQTVEFRLILFLRCYEKYLAIL